MSTHSTSTTSIPLRAAFSPIKCDTDKLEHPALISLGNEWIPLMTSTADFPIELLETAYSQLIHHPEYNSTLILRSDTVSEFTSGFPELVPVFDGLKATKTVHRKLLPRRPGRDTGLEQYCTLYSSDSSNPEVISPTSTLILTPIVPPGDSLPYYHPTVSHIAFRYIAGDRPMLRIEVIPLPNTPRDPNSRLYRTCLALLETLHRYGWGAMTQYKKRVNHDCLVPRDLYQDIYLLMRERHKHIINEWQEVTDPLKHVFEDIGIATFLILLWKDTYKTAESEKDGNPPTDTTRPWLDWPRPPAGFLDFGCGNGLLTHILIAEGYIGEGIDLRARTSWTHYPEPSQAHLHCHAFTPISSPEYKGKEGPPSDPYLVPGIFIIGNHADELTPWLPVLSTLYSASGYISIPCCAWTFDTRYERSVTQKYPVPTEDFADTLNLGGEGSNTSSYSMYRIWLASLSLWCGWKVETECLRIPSTRNWAIVGRRTIEPQSDEDFAGNCRDILEGVQERGIFRSRKPEGKRDRH